MAEIVMKGHHGKETIVLVDEEDYAAMNAHKWYAGGRGYAQRNAYQGEMNGKKMRRTVYMAREILGLSAASNVECAHINRNKLDNTRSNLRIVLHHQNAHNRLKYKARDPAVKHSCYRGVSWASRRRKWHARVALTGTDYHLGYFDDEQAAGRVVSEWRRKHVPFAVEG